MKKGEVRKVMLRIYGQIIHENPEMVVTDSVIFALLAEKGLGPQLHGVFTGGRVEEYISVSMTSILNINLVSVSMACHGHVILADGDNEVTQHSCAAVFGSSIFQMV